MAKNNKKSNSKESLLAELKTLEIELEVVQRQFRSIVSRSKEVVLGAKDKKKIDEIRRSIGLQ